MELNKAIAELEKALHNLQAVAPRTDKLRRAELLIQQALELLAGGSSLTGEATSGAAIDWSVEDVMLDLPGDIDVTPDSLHEDETPGSSSATS